MGRSHPANTRKYWGGTIPPRPTFSKTNSFYGVGRSHLVPPSQTPTVFMGWDDPTSSHLLTNQQFLWGGTTPPRSTFSKTNSFYGVGRSHLVPPFQKPTVFMGTGAHTPKAFGNYFPALTNVPVRENNKANALVNTPTTHKNP